MPAHTEWESCFSSYYDLSDQVPAQFLSDDGTHFRYQSIDIRQDPLSHHLIVDIFRGPEPADHASWGVYKCRGGARDGDVCNPLDIPFCGAGQCATDPDPNAIACIGFGPTGGLGTLTTGGFAFAQETTAHYRFPGGVYDELPIRGVVLWNSHAFNLTRHDGTLEAWVNINFPAVDEQDHQQEQVFNVGKIFWTDAFPPFPAPKLAAFEDMEVCDVHVFGAGAGFGDSALQADETAHLFELSGHTHRHGKRFQIFRGRFTCSRRTQRRCGVLALRARNVPRRRLRRRRRPRPAGRAALHEPGLQRSARAAHRSADSPLRLGAALRPHVHVLRPLQQRHEPNLQDVKRRSTSPPAGVLFDIFSVGGPCCGRRRRAASAALITTSSATATTATATPTAGAGDGDCDACPIAGGFRTEDEMFVLFGNFWVTED